MRRSLFSKISRMVVRLTSKSHDISKKWFAAVMLLAFTAIDVYAFDIPKTSNLRGNVTVDGNGCTFDVTYKYTSNADYNNLCKIDYSSVATADLSYYDKLYVTTSNLSGTYRVIINIGEGDTNKYTATCSTAGKQGLSLTSDFKNGSTTLTKDDLKNVTRMRIGGTAKDVSFTLDDIHFSKSYEPDADGTLTLSLSDFKADGVTIDADGNITAATKWGRLVLEFEDYEDITKIESVTVNAIGFTPSTFYDFYDANDTEDHKSTGWSVSDAKSKNLNTWYQFGLNVGGKDGLSNVNYQLNSVVFKYITYTERTESLSVTYNSVTNTRQYKIYIPSSAKNKSNVPVVFSLHGRGNSMSDGRPDFKTLADDNGFIVVYPQGRSASSTSTDKGSGDWTNGFDGSTGWEATGEQNDDTEFLRLLAEKIKTDYSTASTANGNISVDPNKFYLCGFSMGGMMTYAMANAVPNIFAAYASTGGYPINEFHLNLANINRSPFLHIHPKDDGFVLYSLVETIKQNMVARYGHNWVTSTRNSYNNCDIYDFNSNTAVGALRYIEIDETEKLGHSIAWYAPNMMYDFFNGKSYKANDINMEWSWDMPNYTKGGWVYGSGNINFGNNSNTGDSGNHNVYTAIQLPAGKHVIYAKFSVAQGENNAYLTLKNNTSGAEIVARKLVNNSGQTGNQDMVIAYEFETGADAEYSVYVGRANNNTSCTSLAIYQAPYTMPEGETDQSVNNATVDITSGLVLKIDFEELKRNSSDTNSNHTVEATLLASNQNGVGNEQPTEGFTYYYANRLERKNSAYHYDIIHNDAVFGNYFQNMPHADIYERTGAEDFMRIMFPANTLSTVKGNGAITIGFWVNAKLAIDRGLAYRDPSIFYLAGGSYLGTNKYENPHMFNIQALGGISGYTSDANKYAGGTTFGQFCNTTDRGGFYNDNFYLDRNWHYITYQMYDDFARYNMYVDGFPATLGGHSPTSNTSVLKEGIDGLRSIVLGGLNCRNVPFAYDVAFAYDDVVIYDRVLSHAEIKQIIADKNYTPSWIFYRMLKNTVMFDPSKLSSSLWTDSGNGVYTYNQTNSASAALTYDGIEQIPAFRGLQFKNSANQIKVDTNNGTLQLYSGVTISFTSLADGNTLRFETEGSLIQTSQSHFWEGALPDINGHKRARFTKKGDAPATPELTLTADATIYAIDRTEKQYIDLQFVKSGTEVAETYNPDDIVKTRSYNVSSSYEPDDSPTLRVVNNGYNGGNTDYLKYIKYSSSAPHIARVDIDNGEVTLTGVQGSAVITAELDNSSRKYDTSHGEEALYESSDRIFATYEIINTHDDNKDAYVVTSGQAHSLNETLTLNNNNDDITVTLGGWKFNNGAYQDQNDSYSNVESITGVKCYGFESLNTEKDKYSCIFGDGSSLSTNGAHEAKSEAWNNADNTTGLFTPVEQNTVTANVTPWTLPCRGSHIKVEPVKPGIVTVYVKQEGCVSREGQAKPQSIKLNTVFITDETGKSVRDVLCDTKTRVADQIWKDDGRARGEYTWGDTQYAITNEICQSFEDKSFGWDQKWSFLDNWENPGMTGHVFCVDFYDGNKGVGLDGHVIISTGIVRYTFNVVPGKTYYIFSNNSAIGLAGFTFDAGKHINLVEVQGRKNAYLIANNKTPVVDVSMGSDITLNDNGESFSGVTNSSETAVPRYDEYTHKASGSSGIYAYKPGTMAKVTLSRTFKDKQWAGLCLPYSISNRQMKAAFGEDTKVVLLHHIDDSHVVFINHTNEDIIAGYPYLIFPSGNVKPGYSTVTLGTNGAKTTIKDIVTYATFEQANPLFSVKDQQNQTDLTPTTVAQGTTFENEHHYFIGLFSQGQLGEGSYYISNSTGKLTRIGQTTNAKPYRTYIMWQQSTTGAKAPMLSSMVVEDTEGNNGGTTSIDDVLFEQGIMTQAEDVYTVSGMKMGRMSDMQHLQRGIYIVNGKKFVKK